MSRNPYNINTRLGFDQMIFNSNEPWFRPHLEGYQQDSIILQSYYNHPFPQNLNCLSPGTRVHFQRIPRFNIPHDVKMCTWQKMDQILPHNNTDDWFGTVVDENPSGKHSVMTYGRKRMV